MEDNDKQISSTNDNSVKKVNYKDYIAKIKTEYKNDNSIDICIHSSFVLNGKLCSHKLMKIEDEEQTLLLRHKFKYNDEFVQKLLLPAIVAYATRNPLQDVSYHPDPKKTSTFVVESYSDDGNMLTISGIDEKFAKEIVFNIRNIPAVKFSGYTNSENELINKKDKLAGYIGIFELFLLTFAVTFFVGVVLAIQMMS